MQGQLYMADGRFRSPTAVADKADVRDVNLYSSIVLAHGGQGQQTIFANPRGQAIPTLAGAAIAPTQAHQTRYTELTTSMVKAGEFGSSIGEVSIRALGVTVEKAPLLQDGTVSTYGATPQEEAEILNKVFMQFKVAGKLQTEGPLWSFPAAGGLFGVVSTTANLANRGLTSNGPNGLPRRLKLPILAARNDTIECVIGVAGAASLVFSVQAGVGQATLVYVMLHALAKGDVR